MLNWPIHSLVRTQKAAPHSSNVMHIVLDEKATERDVSYIDFLGQVANTYWISLAGAEDFYVHFANDITEYAAEHMFPDSSTVKNCRTSYSGT